MNFNEYQEKAARTMPNLGSLNDNINHMMMGITTEAGEIVDLHKKFFAYGKPFDINKMVLEIGDLFWYLANLAKLYNIPLDDVAKSNIQKLSARFPDAFKSDLAINKDEAVEFESMKLQSFNKSI